MNTLDKINELEQQLATLKAEIIAEQKSANTPTQWQPEGGDWYIGSSTSVHNSYSEDDTRLAGVERPTKELADKAAKEMRVYKRLLAYRDQFDPDYVENWDGKSSNCFINFDTRAKKYCVQDYCIYKITGVVHMSEEVADELVRKLNSGEVVL